MEGFLLKSRLRKELRHRRRSLDHTTRQSADSMINRTLIELAEKSGCASLSAFLPFDGEPDVRPALQMLHRRGVRIALPAIVNAPAAAELQFRSWNPGLPVEKNLFGIDEPVDSEILPVQDLDVVLLPLVGWDENGGRLGMGAGYYDRALSPVADCDRPLRWGVAYAVQKVALIPTDAWDVSLHLVITENGGFTCTA